MVSGRARTNTAKTGSLVPTGDLWEDRSPDTAALGRHPSEALCPLIGLRTSMGRDVLTQICADMQPFLGLQVPITVQSFL